MDIDLRHLDAGGVVFDETVLPRELANGGPDGLRVLEARLAGEAMPGERGVEFRARLAATLRLDCSRCLEPLELRLALGVELILVPDATEFGVGESELPEEAARLFYAEEGVVRLERIVTEQILLNLPAKPVCRVDCAGLCPACGANRNRIECGCRDEGLDPRLAPLLELKKKLRGP
jgi:uncharacterized protein